MCISAKAYTPDMSPSQARNAIKKSLVEILDREPTRAEKNRALEHFANKCAYCGKGIRGVRAHYDHLQAGSMKGKNHISNRVPACERCNGDEKLADDWLPFLKQKCRRKPAEVFLRRKRQIKSWINLYDPVESMTPETRVKLEAAQLRAITAYNRAVSQIRKIRTSLMPRSTESSAAPSPDSLSPAKARLARRISRHGFQRRD
jgi:hypothetical protein